MTGIEFAQRTLARSLLRHYDQNDPMMVGLLVHSYGISDREIQEDPGPLQRMIVCYPHQLPIMLDHVGPEETDPRRWYVSWFRS